MLESDSREDGEAHVWRAREAMAESPVTAGWVLDVRPQRVEGYMGVSLWVALLGLGGRVSGRRIWIEVSGVQDLLDVADRVRSPEFREGMGEFGDTYI